MPLEIFFDTNALFRQDISNSRDFEAVAKYARDRNIALKTNKVVVTELSNQRERETIYIQKFWKAWYSVLVRQSDIDIKGMTIRPFHAQDDLIIPLVDAGVTIMDNSPDDIPLGLDALYRGLKPTKKNSKPDKKVKREIDHDPYYPPHLDYDYADNQIKDFFIWRSVLALVENRPGVEVAFITDNHKDFCESDCAELHPDLARQFSGENSGTVVRLKNFESLIEGHIEFVEGFDIRALDTVRNSGILAFDETGRSRELKEVISLNINEIHSLTSFQANIRIRSEKYENSETGESIESTQEEVEEEFKIEVSIAADEKSYTYEIRECDLII